MEERLQKILSAAGICSRRAAECYLSAGRITVNGAVATLGDKADVEKDGICVDGIPLGAPPEFVYLMLNKPRGYVTTLSDERGRKTVAALVTACGTRVWPVGRLDLDSEGLLVMTNDGAVTNQLLHPSHEVEKEYEVLVSGSVRMALPILRGEITLDGTLLRPARVEELGAQMLSITIHEGKNRQVRRMCELAGLSVRGLRRVREGELRLGNLRAGQWRVLTPGEVAQLQALA